jgi:hypothetical protein
MLQLTQSTESPSSEDGGILNRSWRTIRFTLARRSFESQLEGILKASAAHQSNSLAVGAYEYQVLADEADSLCERFADQWSLDLDSLRAKIPGLSKLEHLSTPKQLMNYGRLAWFIAVGIPVGLFIMGALVGLVSLGFHFTAGGR